ncbi:restriction endonuclease subunit S [Microbacterium sp. NPDC059771]|uniref:restriction endonuclease subunit S n=1 Tax=Microbacterium sp. NPDC059771 TaxID=3346941 RepID=UPI00365AFB65
MTSLADVCSHIVDCKNRTAPTDTDGEYFAIGTPAMRGNVINFREARRINALTFKEWTARLIPEPGDLLLAREAPVGPVVIVPPGDNIAAGQRTTLLRVDPRIADARYLRHYLVAAPTQARLLSRAHGSTTPHLRVDDIRNFDVDLPSLDEQRAIAEVLGALDDKIAANTALAAAADNVVRVEYETLDAPYVRIDSVATSPRVKADPVHLASQETYVGLEHLGRRNMWLSESGTASQVTSAKSRFESRDVLFGKLRPYFHKVVGAPTDGICSTDILVLRARNAADSSMLLAAVSSDSVISEVVAASEGTRMPRTSWKDLASVNIRWPNDASRSTMGARLDSIRDSAEAAIAENTVLEETRDALLPHLMSGKLRIRDAEAVAAAAGA